MKISDFLKSILLAILLSIFLFPLTDVKAANEFSTSYDIIYSVSEDGTTEVTENIKPGHNNRQPGGQKIGTNHRSQETNHKCY